MLAPNPKNKYLGRAITNIVNGPSAGEKEKKAAGQNVFQCT